MNEELLAVFSGNFGDCNPARQYVFEFVRKLSEMTPEQYKTLSGGDKSDESHHHDHGTDNAMDHEHQPGS